jgi:hypothetical protein
MAMYDGTQWISDFLQTDMHDGKEAFWPGKEYRKEQPSYVIYRHRNRK